MLMDFEKDLKQLDALIDAGGDMHEANERLADVAGRYMSEEGRKQLERMMNASSTDELTALTDRYLKETTTKMQLGEVSEIISLSYVAKHYFNKTKAWLYQRINGNIVNGKPCRFTPEELETFNRALQDISRRIGSLNLTARP